MAYDVPLRVLSLTPTRDGVVNPSHRLPDKHSRLFCGKTLDEWTMLQLWSSKHVSKAVFVCETENHAIRLSGKAKKYDVELIVRPREMLHPINDSGALVLLYGLLHMLMDDYYSLLMTPFVVSPLRPPGFFDHMVEVYLDKMNCPDESTLCPMVVGAHEYPDRTQWKENEQGRGENISHYTFNSISPGWWETRTQHWICATWFYVARSLYDFTRQAKDEGVLKPIFFELPEWTEIHIDTEENWKEAEYWFKEKILSQGEDCYHKYREGWEND